MSVRIVLAVALCGTVSVMAFAGRAQQSAPAGGSTSPDPWPRQYQLPSAELLIYQPQVESWQGNRLSFRAAVGATPPGAKEPAFGVVWATARTEVDPIRRAVTLQDVQATRSNFPTLPDHGAQFLSELQKALPSAPRSISLDRLEASLAASGSASAKPVAVDNRPPEIIVSTTPAILIPIDGAPVLRAVANTAYERIINTAALILRRQSGAPYYLHAYDGWLSAEQVDGPWRREDHPMEDLDRAAREVPAGAVDLLNGGGSQPAPSLANGVPTVYVRHTPAELIVFKGEPNFQPIGTTDLLWAANTTSDVLFDTGDNDFYVLISGRWYRSAAAQGPWSYVSSKDLPAAFKEIPPSAPSGVVLATVAGTPQAKEAVIEASIPRTATVPLEDGPKFAPVFDGAPQLRPIEGTKLSYVVNSPDPIIEVAPGDYYALRAGIWFAAPTPTGPWTIATAVPAPIYGIPPTSPLHYVTYVEVYGATPEVVYVGYTPGYLGSVVAPDGVVVYGTGYDYQPWVGSEWYPPPETYGVEAEPVYNPAVGWAYGAALGLTTAALVDSWGNDNNNHDSNNYYYAPDDHGYPCCGSTSAHVYGQYGDTYSSGKETWYSHSDGNEGRDYSGSYTNYATGTTGDVSASQNFDENSGKTTDSLNRTFDSAGGTTGDAQRSASYDPKTGTTTTSGSASATNRYGDSANEQRSSSYDAQTGTSSYDASRSGSTPQGGTSSAQRSSGFDAKTGESDYDASRTATGQGGSSITRQTEGEAGAQGSGVGHETSVYDARTGQTKSAGSGWSGGDHYAGADGQVYRNSGSGWQKNTSSGWQSASGDSSWADREQQARSQGADRFSSFSGGGWDRFGGGGDRWGGGHWGGGGGFGGGRFGGFRR